jgi:formate dehydrogenase maturation protein FdhE
MDRVGPEKPSGTEARDDGHIIFCPTCASRPRLIISIVDSRKGKTVRVFECECGEIVWDD